MAEERHATTTESVLEHHLTAFGSGELDELLSDYTDDAVVISPERVYRGLDELTEFFGPMLEEFDQPDVDFTLDVQRVEGDTAFITWHAETPANVYAFATDTFVLEDGEIVLQTYAADVTSKV